MAYIGITLTVVGLTIVIERLNLKYMDQYGGHVPAVFEGLIDEEELRTINQYTLENSRFKLIETCFNKLFLLLIILCGILPWLTASLARTHFLLAGLVFFAVLGFLTAVVDLPFDYYHSFVIEDRYGFNTKTIGIWLADLAKSALIAAVLGALLLSALLLLIRYAGQTWWLWAWAVLLGFQILMTILYPTIIAPYCLFKIFLKGMDIGHLSTRLKIRFDK